MKKTWKVTACAACLCAGLVLPTLAVGNYTDVEDGVWYAQAVTEVSSKGYMTGTVAGLFSPDLVVTRATVLTTLWRLEGSPAPAGAASFPDVEMGAWYESAAAWAKEQSIAVGSDKGELRPNQPVTRQELAVFLYRYAQFKGGDIATGSLNLYSDSKMASMWALDGLKHAVGLGLLQGSEGKLNPGGVASRAQLAVILQRLTTPVVG